MKTFDKCSAQGDAYIRRVEKLPEGVKQVEPTNGKYIAAHSETGHNHVISAHPGVKFYDTDNPMLSYLEVIEATDAAETVLEHMRSYDTHESIKFSPGIYEVRRQRENSPEGWRKVSD